MTALILCVDRDDDFGTKAKIKSPIIGREANLNAALALGLADPEDPDANTLLTAIKMYDDFIKEGKEVKLATICGSPKIGLYSDELLAKQLDEVLVEFMPDDAILVSDGAEDEYILPLITSRIKIASIKRVIMKQAQNIESSYYFIAKALKDERVQRKFIVPVALFLLIISLTAILGYPTLGLAAVGFVIGIYLLVSAFNLEPTLAHLAKDFKEGLMTGRISLFTSLLAGLVFIVGLLITYTQHLEREISIQGAFSVIAAMVWWAIGASILVIFGRVIDKYVREGEILWPYWIVPFSLVTFGLIILAITDVLNNLDKGLMAFITPPLFWYLLSKISLAVVIGFIGITTYRYIRRKLGEKEKGTGWRY